MPTPCFRRGTSGSEALSLWATQVPDGMERLADMRAELRTRGACGVRACGSKTQVYPAMMMAVTM